MRYILIIVLIISALETNAQGQARCVLTGSIHLTGDNSAIRNAQIYLSPYEPKRGEMDVNWTSSFTDMDGNFRIDLKGESNYLRVIRQEGDTIDLSVAGVQCNTHRDILVDLIPKQANDSTYAIGDATFMLSEVTLEAYGKQSTIERIPASIGYVDKRMLENNDQSSLQHSLNTIAGVTMESRGYGGSHRLNIRGSSLRSPFAVRNIKMYLDGIPLTGADGQTPLELIDASDLESIEVIKGPAGSMYGSGNGGVLLLKSATIDSGNAQVQSGFQAASFGGYRWNSKATVGFSKSQLRVSHNWQEYAGYREQEFNRKQQVSISFIQQLKPTQRLSLWGTYYNGNWGLPGALNKTQADTLPQQAVPFSVLNNASLNRERWVGAITQSGNWNKHFDHFITLNVHHTKKVNPYGTSTSNSGYKDENSKSLTGRAVGRYKNEWRSFHLLAQAGAEWQVETYSILEQTIQLGEPSSFKYIYDVAYRQYIAFAQTEMNWKDKVFLDAGISYNDNIQFVRGRNSEEFLFDTTTTWDKTILPRFTFSLQPLKGLFLYSSYSEGTANPTVFEMIDQEHNAYNTNLVSEIGTLYETGIKHHIEALNISYSITAYQFNITGAILPYKDNDLDRYRNAGSTTQQGIEWSVKYTSDLIKNKLSITAWNNGGLNNPRFVNYQVDENKLGGYRIPGVALAQVNSGLDIQFKGFSLAIQDFWLDRMPLNNINTEWSSSYHLTNIIFHYHFNRNKSLQWSVHAGANNVLNTSYTSFFNLNAFGGKYYNPAPPLNLFAGFRISYTMGTR